MFRFPAEEVLTFITLFTKMIKKFIKVTIACIVVYTPTFCDCLRVALFTNHCIRDERRFGIFAGKRACASCVCGIPQNNRKFLSFSTKIFFA